MSIQEITVDCKRGFSSQLEDFLLLLYPQCLWLILFFLHWFYARFSLFLLLFSIFPWITEYQVVFFHMAKFMTCVALPVANIWSNKIKSPVAHVISIPCMQCASPLVISASRCLMDKHVTWVIITIKTMITLVRQTQLTILLQAPLIISIHFVPTDSCNMSKYVKFVTFCFMPERKKRTLFPLKF